MIEIRETRYGPGGPPDGYYVDIGPWTFYVEKSATWGWFYPTVVRVTDE